MRSALSQPLTVRVKLKVTGYISWSLPLCQPQLYRGRDRVFMVCQPQLYGGGAGCSWCVSHSCMGGQGVHGYQSYFAY